MPRFEVVMVSRDFMCELTKTEKVHNSRPIYSNEETPPLLPKYGESICYEVLDVCTWSSYYLLPKIIAIMASSSAIVLYCFVVLQC